MSGSWFDAPENPFNQMSWTRGGGGYDNAATRESNARREHAMPSDSSDSLPRYANRSEAAKQGPGLAVVGDDIVFTPPPKQGGSGAGSPGASTNGGGGAGPGNAGVANAKPRTAGAGSRLVISAPLNPKLNPDATALLAGGNLLPMDRGWSDAGEAEERYGDSEFLSPTWFYTWGVAAADILHGVNEAVRPHAEEYRQRHGIPDEPRGGGGWDMLVQTWNRVNSARLDSNGQVVMTGGGF